MPQASTSLSSSSTRLASPPPNSSVTVSYTHLDVYKRQSTHRPESSAMVGRPLALQMVSALMRAFSAKVVPVSSCLLYTSLYNRLPYIGVSNAFKI